MKKEEFGKRNPFVSEKGGEELQDKHSIQDNCQINGNKEMEPDYHGKLSTQWKTLFYRREGIVST